MIDGLLLVEGLCKGEPFLVIYISCCGYRLSRIRYSFIIDKQISTSDRLQDIDG